MTVPVDRRDGYRAQVDLAVRDFGGGAVSPAWTPTQLARARRISYRTIWAETDWRNLGNASIPESEWAVPNDGPGHDLDSTGLYQQRASQGWGSVGGSMNPYVATLRFLAVMLRDVPGWFGFAESTVCQKVQRSQYDSVTIDPKTGLAYPFAANYAARGDQVDALEADLLYFQHHP